MDQSLRPEIPASIRVLLVEDNPADAELVVEYLRDVEALGFGVVLHRVTRLAPAVEHLARPQPGERPDVVLLDLMLPDSDGLETVRRVRAAAPGVPVVVLTGMEQHSLAVEALRCGAQDYLHKGRLDGDLLLRTVRAAIERERLQRALHADQEVIRTAMEWAPIGKALLGLDGRWRVVNRALCELTGYTEEELLARTLDELTHPDDRDADRAHVERLLAGEARSYAVDKRYVHKDGRVGWAQLAVSLVRDETGDPHYFIAQVQDVTERRRAAERTQQLLAVTAALTGARTPREVADRIVTRVVDALGAASACVCAHAAEDGQLRLLAAAGLPDEAARAWERLPISAPAPLLEALREGRPVWLQSAGEIAECYPAPAGRAADRPAPPAHDALAVLPLALGDETIGVLAVGYAPPDDLPPERAPARRFEPEDRALLERVTHQCALALARARLYEAEREASVAAHAASEAKSRFLAVMSHELRTPLSVIVGFAELMTEGHGGAVTEKQRGYLTRIRASADHLLAMIDDILTLTQLEAGRESMRPEPVRLSELVHEVAALFDPTAQDKNVALGLDLPEADPTVVTDARKLRQILVNLLGNALKFTDARDGRPGRVDVRVRDGQPALAIEVEDTGIGIAQEHLARIFEPFWQVDQSARRRAGGAGLGLDVSMRLARLLGGDLRVHSTPGRGSTFTLVLPRDGVPAPPADGHAADGHGVDARGVPPPPSPLPTARRDGARAH